MIQRTKKLEERNKKKNTNLVFQIVFSICFFYVLKLYVSTYFIFTSKYIIAHNIGLLIS